MFRLFEQNRLGSYDPILLGTLCNIDAITRHPDYQDFVALGMSAFVAQPGSEHRRFVDAQKTSEDKVVALSLFTLLAHENRHFWDAITSASGLRMTGNALEIQCEYLTRCAGLPFQGPVCFPFSEWIREREALATLSPELASPPREAAAFASSVQSFVEEFNTWNTGGALQDGSPSSIQILEGLAVLAQGESIERNFGKPARTLFDGVMRLGDTGRFYLGAIDYVRRRLPELDKDGIGLLLQMSLYGTVERPWEESSPAAVLPYLVDRFEQTRPRFPVSFEEQFVLCDGWLTNRQGMGPHAAFGVAGKALFKRLNEIGARVSAQDGEAALPLATDSTLSSLLQYVGTTVNIGARIVQRVLFGGSVSNLRITHQSNAMYEVPRGTPYFESSQGLLLAGANIEGTVLPLIGAALLPGWRTVLVHLGGNGPANSPAQSWAGSRVKSRGQLRQAALGTLPDNDFLALLQPLRDDQPVHLLNLFSPVGENMPEHMQIAWSLFPHMLMCRMAMIGPLETHSLATVLQSEFLSAGGHPVYSQGRLIAPMKTELPLHLD
jgi:hypothetical protein